MPIKRIDLKETTQYTLVEYNDVLSTSTPARKTSQVGEIVIDTGGDPNNPRLYIANISGSLNPVGGGGGNGSPGGPTYSVQYNLLGAFGGNSTFTFNPSSSLLTTPNLTVTGTSTLGANANVKITGGSNGQALITDGAGNLRWGNAGGGSGAVLVTSNITSLQAGQPLLVALDTSNVSYPGGIFTIYQPSGTPTITMTNQWASGGTSKNAYVSGNTVNTQNVSVTLTATNTSFAVTGTDTITLGSSSVTGANLLSLGITGSGGTYNIPATFFSPSIQIAASTPVSANLTTLAGALTATGNTLTTTVANTFTFTNVTGSFASSSVGYWAVNQALNWAAQGVVGNVTAGNVVLRQGGSNIVTLTSTGAVSGTANANSVLGNLTISATYTGDAGSGPTTVGPIISNVTSATAYYPLMTLITANSAQPNITVNNAAYTSNFALGQGANSSSVITEYAWIALPSTVTTPTFYANVAPPPFPPGVVTPDATFSNVAISGVNYNIYGFTNFGYANVASFIYTG